MKLKPVVASLVLLGLMTPAFAKSNILSQQAVIDQNSALTPLCTDGWFNRIQVGGLANIIGIAGDRDPAGMFKDTSNSSDLYLNNLNLLVNAKLSSWSKFSFNLAYLGSPTPWQHVAGMDTHLNRNIKHSVVADEAYVQISDLTKSPFYFVVGKKYIPFGDYKNPYFPVQIMSPTQMLAQTNAVTAIAGLTSDFGLYANVSAFRGETAPEGSTTGNIRNFTAKLGYYENLDEFNIPNAHINANLGYIHNLWDSQFFSPNAEPQYVWGSSNLKAGHPAVGYNIDPVGGASAHFDLAYKAFSMSANWVGSIKKMVSSIDNSKFWGADVGADYAFKTLDRDSHLGATFQWSGHGSWFTATNPDWSFIVPKWRLVGEYTVNIFKNTDLGLTVAHGKSYDFTPGTSRNTTVGLVRLGVQL
ncbi:MAG: LbtU family siderophore porin [Gammaproteobacteria bacterium]|nr:LbtU family siderophore porin [Gammaproteobacteria bacterium]